MDFEAIMSKTNDTDKTRELTESELNQVSGGKPEPKPDTFPTETIKFTYGSIEWTYTNQ